ncbi:hypothetical protein [Lignipirellula cremea]|uniref:Uncharacterized protein n=1 Tax=Lignipirellula cremea TaxID=2528010 RepID=A0A518DLB2_9BACT|nr:hypothetical protein [Lignipirellula cremea]QDU92621.1 hypothetical protein Pla8534_03690 [Lignipirellula cremea]
MRLSWINVLGVLTLIGSFAASTQVASAQFPFGGRGASVNPGARQLPSRMLPRPTSRTFGLGSSNAPRAKDAPPPSAPPSTWRDYVHDKKIKTPPIRPKSQVGPQFQGLGASNAPRAKDAPPPSAPPSTWRDFVHDKKIKTPPIRPKSQVNPDYYDGVWRRPGGMQGFPPPQSKPSPRQKTPPTFPRDIRAPYVHPPRDLKPPKFPK